MSNASLLKPMSAESAMENLKLHEIGKLEKMNMKELRAMATQHNIEHTTRTPKQALIELLTPIAAAKVTPDAESKETIDIELEKDVMSHLRELSKGGALDISKIINSTLKQAFKIQKKDSSAKSLGIRGLGRKPSYEKSMFLQRSRENLRASKKIAEKHLAEHKSTRKVPRVKAKVK